MDRLEIYQRIIATGVIPIYYSSDISVSKRLLIASYEGGAKAIEFTNRGEKALEVFSELVRFVRDQKLDLSLGIGSIVDPFTAAVFRSFGAQFFVGPFMDETLSRWCNKLRIPYIPGCMSISEVSRAEEFGAEIVKVFPGDLGGPKFVKSILGPMPWCKLMPTGGVSPEKENIYSWLSAGAVCVGIGSKLFTPELLQAQNYGQITETVAKMIGWVKDYRH